MRVRLLLGFLAVGCVIISSWVCPAHANGAAVDDFKFPYLLRMGPEHVLVVHGQEMPDSVLITWEPGDSVRIDGITVYPGPYVLPIELSDNALSSIYKNVPFMVNEVSSGRSWKDAAAEYNGRRDAVCRQVRRRYWAVRDSTGDHDLAARAAIESMDRSLLKPGVEPKASLSSIVVCWDGAGTEFIHMGTAAPTEKPREPEVVDESEASGYARQIVQWLGVGGGTPKIAVIGRYGGLRYLAGDKAAEAILQVQDAKRGVINEGPLGRNTLDDVVHAYRGE